jgi:GNAT superfamily N-acetyltransferase
VDTVVYTTVGPCPSELERKGFVAAYQAAFAGPPYFEQYTFEEVIQEVWNPHREHGMIVLATHAGEVIGFGCALPLLKSPDDIQEYTRARILEGSLDAHPDNVWYMSELGVTSEYRGRGIGTQLVKHRLLSIQHTDGTHYMFRTAAQGSNSIRIYQRIGAIVFPTLQDVSTSAQVIANGSQSTERVYLHGECETALRAILS